MAKEMAEYLNIITGMDNLEELKILRGVYFKWLLLRLI